MTDPPYSKENNLRPKYVRELGINWSGVPLFNTGVYILKAAATPERLSQLQVSTGVIDFPNVDGDRLENLPEARKNKDRQIKTSLKLADIPGENVREFINRSANSEVNHDWRKDGVFVPDAA